MMQDNKKAAPVLQHQGGKVETGAASRQATTSNHKSTTPAPVGQAVKIADFLSPGQQNAVPLKHLKDLLHLDGRKVRLMIRAERLAGTPILADNQTGYYLPGNDHERARCVRSMRRRAAEIVKAADAIEEAADIGG